MKTKQTFANTVEAFQAVFGRNPNMNEQITGKSTREDDTRQHFVMTQESTETGTVHQQILDDDGDRILVVSDKANDKLVNNFFLDQPITVFVGAEFETKKAKKVKTRMGGGYSVQTEFQTVKVSGCALMGEYTVEDTTEGETTYTHTLVRKA